MSGPIRDADLTVFKDLTGVHEFTDSELASLHRMAEEAKEILSASKRREQDRLRQKAG